MDFAKELVFTARAQHLSSDATTMSLYQTLLGRDPENSFVLEEAKTQPIAELFRSFLASAEFEDYVLGPVREGLRLRHELMAPAPTDAQRAWMGSLMVLTAAQESALKAASTWRDFFCAFLPPALVTPRGNAAVTRTLGRIEHCGPDGIRGWALRWPMVEHLAEIECFIGETRLGRAICGENRPDLKELLGGSGQAGFTLLFEKDVPLESFNGLEVRLVDAYTNALICAPQVFDTGAAFASDVVSRLRTKVAAMEWQFAAIKLMLEDLGREPGT